MKLPPNTVIALRKLSEYLLRWRAEDDKSQFLSLAGYTSENADRLLTDLREQILSMDAEWIEQSEYGPKYRIRGTLKGPSGNSLQIESIWMKENATNVTKFVTLFPSKR